jgi:hypothetical protein
LEASGIVEPFQLYIDEDAIHGGLGLLFPLETLLQIRP